MIRPHALHRALAYVATGSMPPFIRPGDALRFTTGTALCLAIGFWIGSSI